MIEQEQFRFPMSFDGLEVSEAYSIANYVVDKGFDVQSLAQEAIIGAIDRIERHLLQDCLAVQSHDNFDRVYFSIKWLKQRDSAGSNSNSNNQLVSMQRVAVRLADCLCHVLSNVLKRVTKMQEGQPDVKDLRTAFKMVLFLVFYLMEVTLNKKKVEKGDLIAEALNKQNKKKRNKRDQGGSGSAASEAFKFLEDRQKSLIENVKKSLSMDFKKLWQKRDVDSDLLKYYSDLGMRVLQSPVSKLEGVRNDVFVILEIVLKDNVELLKKVQISLISLLYQEDVVDNLVQFFSKAESPEMRKMCVETLMLTIAHLLSKQNVNAESQAIKNMKQFLSKLSEAQPRLFFNNLNCFIKLYDNQAYLLRNAISDILFNIIRKVMVGEGEDTLKAKDKYINTLVRRIHDKHTHCRGYILNLLAQLTRENKVPRNSLPMFLAAAVDRLRDTGVHTRKRAIHLISEILNVYRYVFDQHFKTTAELEAERSSNQHEHTVYTAELDRLMESAKDVTEQSRMEELDKEIKLMRKKISDCQQMQLNLSEYIEVLKKIKEATQTLEVLLASKNLSDVVEAIKLFMFLKETGVEGLQESLSKINLLVFSKEKGVKQEVENCFAVLYLKNQLQASNNLVKLFSAASLQELTCLEEILEGMLKQGSAGKHSIPPETFSLLWARFFRSFKSGVDDAATRSQRRACLAILRVSFTCKPRQLLSNYIATLMDILKKYNETRFPDFLLIRQINKIAEKCSEQLGPDTKNLIMSTSGILIREQNTEDPDWYSACEQLLTTIFATCEYPEQYSELLINQMHKRLAEKNTRPALSRFIYCLSHTSLKLLIHLDALQLKLKGIRQEAEKPKPGAGEDNQLQKVVGGIEGEFEARIVKLHSLADSIVTDPFIAKWLRIIENIVRNSSGSSELERSAVLAYCKFMCISENYCRENMQKVFGLLLRPDLDPVIKNNVIVSIGDLLHRFPNVVEPHSRFLYQNLHDKNPRVRKTAMIVLTHLILNSMVRLKGEICDFALLFEDQSPDIQNLTRLFFNEINKKDPHLLYNALPDAITRLSNVDNGPVKESTFNMFAKNILGLLQKEKTSQSLIEKLSQRFGTSVTLLELRNTANVLSQLNYNEKGLRKLIQNFQLIRGKLSDYDIANYFKALLFKIKKNTKLMADHKTLVEELESKLGSHNEQVYDPEAVKKRNNEKQPSKALAKKKQPKKKGAGRQAASKMVEESSESDEEEVVVAQPRRELRSRRPQRQIIVESSEDNSQQDY